ncbi:cytochrome oxidase Cu insertion factor (SCO1/SenC/PrrC family) [Hydrogenophaga palleronii]|uniref:Cytochrome oxidase Cu insertion factor (SCO1/SenC/PrrC family) n=1 Tax=Hydrogenophaga palleronii TaxID=65655 RepID=A0ABU1WMY9_9BURK|nr:hypothetical protein [Hydrogenophaga palleronii]MDR7150287.1 cytochrome oxidase Cu insertion factor (SCO1/SenC/PrrC family) [Hydrogenophaga palleronii]
MPRFPVSCAGVPADPLRRAATLWLGGLALGVTGLLAGCDQPSPGATSPVFKGIDITSATYGREFALTDFNGQPRTLADNRGQVVIYLFDRDGRLRVALRHEQTVDDYTADIRRLLAEKPV